MAYITSRKHARAPQTFVSSFTPSAAAAIALLALPLAAGAQTAPAQPASAPTSTLPEVKVKATTENNPYKAEAVSNPKFTQPLIDTPQTITVIKKELLRDQGAVSLSDALRNTPGITFQMGENGNTTTGDSVFMRGFDTSGSIFVDGIRDLGTITRDVFNIEQVEVVKGPAGTDVGRGSPSGYINLSTKVPNATNAVGGTVSYGSAERKRVTADLNRVLNDEGSVAVRLNVMAQDGGVPGRDYVENKSWALAPSIAFGLGTTTKTYLQFLHVEQNNRPDGGIPTLGLAGFYNANLTATGGTGAKVDTSNYYGYLSDHDDVEGNMFTARVEHRISPTTVIRNISRWGRTAQDLTTVAPFAGTINPPTVVGAPPVVPGDPSTWIMRVLPQGKLQRNEILANQTNLTTEFKTGSVEHSFSGGVEFARETQLSQAKAAAVDATNGYFIPAAGTTAASYQAFVNPYSPNPNRPFVPVTTTGASTEGSITTAAIYAFDTLKFNEQWQLTGGLRYERYSVDFIDIPAPAATPVAASRRNKAGDLFTGKLGLVFKPLPNGTIYGAVATSAKPPGSDFSLTATSATNPGTNANNPNVDPQEATTAEVGTKWDLFDNRLSVTAAAFRTTNKNELANVDPLTNSFVSFGKTRVQGVEFGLSGMITPAWQLSAGIAHIDAEILEGTATTTGSAIRYSPKLTATLWTTYKLPFGLSLGGGARYIDTQARSTSNAAVTPTTSFATIPSYTVFDALVGYEVNKNLSVQLNVYNLADKFYLNSVNNGGGRYVLGTPRSALLTANLQF
jgi:catecholate siderophore receptor